MKPKKTLTDSPVTTTFTGAPGFIDHLLKLAETKGQHRKKQPTKVIPFDGTPGSQPGKVGGTFAPTEILYHRLQVNLGPVSYQYLEGSGIYKNPTSGGPVDIADFMHGYFPDGDLSDLNNLTYAGPLYNMTGTGGAPIVMIKTQCYVVIEINGPADTEVSGFDLLEQAYPPPTTADDYCNLLFYTSSSGNPAPPNPGCTLFAFAAQNTGHIRSGINDKYNIYLRIGAGTLLTVDPFIKNRGKTPKSPSRKRPRR